MRYFVAVNGRTHEVEVRERLGQLEVSVKGVRLDLQYVEVDALGQVALLVGGRSFGISIDGDANQCSVSIAGHHYSVAIEDEREYAAHAAERSQARKGGVVKSVMPGVVVRLLVEPGESVEAGQPLLILEAMKMQNEIGAPQAGRVAQILVAQGQAVGAGAQLVRIESQEST